MTDPAAAGTPRSSFLDRLGPRVARRPQPRASIALAGAGCALAVAGVLTLAGDAGVSDDGGFNRTPGVILSLLVVGAGLLVLQLRDQGPLATAGSVAVAAGTPAAIGFLVVGGGDGRLDTAITLSALAWLVTYLVGPGRGRPVFLGLAVYGAWSTILQVVGVGGATSLLALTPLGWFTFGESCEYDSFTGSSSCTSTGPLGMGFDQPDWAALGLVSLAVAVGCFLLSRWLDRNGRHGMSTPFVFVGLLAVVQGVIALGIELEDAHGAGAVILAAGVALALFGGSTGRRFTTWFGGAASALGVGLIVVPDVDSASTGGLLLLGSGLVVVVVTHLVAEQLGEPDELALPVAGGAEPTGAHRIVAPVPVPVVEPEPDWAAAPTLLELEPRPATPAETAATKPVKPAVAKKAAPKKQAATKRAAPTKGAAPKKQATTAKATTKKATPVKRAAKKRPTP